jgi:hypothetical protein
MDNIISFYPFTVCFFLKSSLFRKIISFKKNYSDNPVIKLFFIFIFKKIIGQINIVFKFKQKNESTLVYIINTTQKMGSRYGKDALESLLASQKLKRVT